MQLGEFAQLLSARSKNELERAEEFIWFKSYLSPSDEVSLGDIANLFFEARLGQPNQARLRRNLASSRRTLRGRAPDSFILTREASAQIAEKFPEVRTSRETNEILTPFSKSLRTHIEKIQDTKTHEFLSEAVMCMEHRLFRAAVVFSWVGAISVLQDYVLKHKLDEFNNDAVKNKILRSPAKSIEDLRDISKESHFLESLARISLIDGSVKKALKECLDRRNQCGHPTEIALGEPYVAHHIDVLLRNVFSKFAT